MCCGRTYSAGRPGRLLHNSEVSAADRTSARTAASSIHREGSRRRRVATRFLAPRRPVFQKGMHDPMTHCRFWTAAQQDQVARLLAASLSYSGIAARLHKTRNAIAGIIHRNKPLQLIGRRPAVSKPAAARKKREFVVTKPAQPARAQPEPPQPIPAPAMRLVGLVDLERFECKWPVEVDLGVIGHHRFCGAPTTETYCRHHAAISTPAKEGRSRP